MKKTVIILLCMMLWLLAPHCLFAQDELTNPVEEEEIVYSPMELWGLGIKASTDGFGFELIKGFGQNLNIRLGYSTMTIPFSYDLNLEDLGLNATAEFRFRGANLFVDYYPVKNILHLTAGMVYNTMSHAVEITSLSSYPYGDITVPPSEVGSLSATLTPGLKFSPYLALGVGNTLSRAHRVSFNFEMGAMYHGAPQLGLEGQGIIGPIASEHNQQVLMTAIEQYKWFPMASIQLSFRIF